MMISEDKKLGLLSALCALIGGLVQQGVSTYEIRLYVDEITKALERTSPDVFAEMDKLGREIFR